MISAPAPINYGNVVAGSNVIPAQTNFTYFFFRGTGMLVPLVTGLYTIGVNCQDGCNLFIGTQPIVANLTGSDTANSSLGYTQSGTILLSAGVFYPITIEWAHGGGANYEFQLIWTPPLGSMELIPNTCITDTTGTITGALDGSWWNGTAKLYYPGGNGTIDFANAAHPNKTLDNIADGTARSLLVPSGTGKIAASAASNLAAAPINDVITADGAGNLQDSGVLLSSFLTSAGGNIATGNKLSWNSDVGLSRGGAGVLLIGNGTAGDATGTVVGQTFQAGYGATNGTAIMGQGGSAHTGYISFQNPSGTQMAYIGYNTTPYTDLLVTLPGGGAFGVVGPIKDSTGAVGTSGQVLTSTVTGTAWAAGGGGTLASLSDVTVSSPTNGQALLYNSTSGKWQNTTLSGGGGGTLAALTDVSLTSPAIGQTLVYNGSLWINQTPSGGGGGIYPSMTPPTNAAFTWNNPNSYSVTNTDKTGREVITIPGGSLGVAWMQNTALPSYPYTIDLGMYMFAQEDIQVASINLMDGSGAIRAYGLRIDSANAWSLVDQTWTNVTTPSTENVIYVSDGMNASDHLVFVRITDDGSNRKFYWSVNGNDYIFLSSQTSGTGITPTHTGIQFYNTTSASLMTSLVYHWLVSTSILPQNA